MWKAALADAADVPCDGVALTREVDVLVKGSALEKEHFTVPIGPGLGIKIYMDLVERYRVV